MDWFKCPGLYSLVHPSGRCFHRCIPAKLFHVARQKYLGSVSHETAESELQNIVIFCQECGRTLQTLTDPCNISGKAIVLVTCWLDWRFLLPSVRICSQCR